MFDAIADRNEDRRMEAMEVEIEMKKGRDPYE